MVDLVSCAAELSLIASIAVFAHASAVILETFIPHLKTLFILICLSTLFYLLVVRFACLNNPSFKFIYWKYLVISFLAVDRDFREDQRYVFDFSIGLWSFLFWEFVVFSLNGGDLSSCFIAIVRYLQSPSVVYRLDTTLFRFDNGIGITGLGFISITFGAMVVVLEWICNVVTGIVLLRLLDKLSLEYYVVSLSFVFQRLMSFSDGIPFPFGIIWYFICYYIVGFVGIDEEYYVRGINVLEMFILYSSSAIFFCMHYFCSANA